MPIEDAHRACFEAGIKFGALYHQFVGTPVSPDSAASLEAAIEEAIENQPYCVEVTARIDPDALELTRGYAELTGAYLNVDVTVQRAGVTVQAAMAMEDGYPLMRLEHISNAESAG